jgi:hypothetical protein
VQKTSPNGFVPLFIYTRVLLMAARRSNGIDNYSAVISSPESAALMNFSTLHSTRRETHGGRKKNATWDADVAESKYKNK